MRTSKLERSESGIELKHMCQMNRSWATICSVSMKSRCFRCQCNQQIKASRKNQEVVMRKKMKKEKAKRKANRNTNTNMKPKKKCK